MLPPSPKNHPTQTWPRQHELLRNLLADLGGSSHPLNRAVLQELSQGGKRLRAWLPAAALEALTTSASDDASDAALWLGLALELVHVATLCHDDVMDGDDTRRGRAATWRRIGVSRAITLGDYLFFVAQEAVARSPLDDAAKLGCMRDLSRLAQKLARGQALENALVGSDLPTAASYAEIARGKTGALFGAALRFGAICAGDARTDALEALGLELGHAYQIANDLAAFTPSGVNQGTRFPGPSRGTRAERTDSMAPRAGESAPPSGREPNLDLWEGKPSWLVAHAALCLDVEEAEAFAIALYRRRDEKSHADVEALRSVLERAGSFAAGRYELHRRLARVLRSAQRIEPELAAPIAAALQPIFDTIGRTDDDGARSTLVSVAA